MAKDNRFAELTYTISGVQSKNRTYFQRQALKFKIFFKNAFVNLK